MRNIATKPVSETRLTAAAPAPQVRAEAGERNPAWVRPGLYGNDFARVFSAILEKRGGKLLPDSQLH